MEGYFSIVECHAAPAIQRLCETGELNLADRSTIAFFVAFLEGKTLGGLERLERPGGEASMSFFASHAGDPEEYAEMYRVAIGYEDPEVIEKHREWLIEALKDGRVRISDPKAFALDMLLNAAADTSQVIFVHVHSRRSSARSLPTASLGEGTNQLRRKAVGPLRSGAARPRLSQSRLSCVLSEIWIARMRGWPKGSRLLERS